MKITIEPTGDEPGYPTVSVSRPDDTLTIDSVIEDLVRPALIAWGFHPDTVRGAFEQEESE
jgi:hypothetical protein